MFFLFLARKKLEVESTITPGITYALTTAARMRLFK